MSTLRACVIACLLALAAPSLVSASGLDRDLATGSVGDDVRVLQVFLNSDPDTRVAAAGAGSPGNESTYFGAATAAAVTRLQAKYPDETYRKAGLAAPTSLVGPLTRQFINARLGYVARTTVTGGFVYDPTASALPPLSVPKYDDPVVTSTDVFYQAFQREAALTVAQNKAAALSFVTRFASSATSSVAVRSASTTTASRIGPGSSATTATTTPYIALVGPTVAEPGDRVNVFGLNLPKDLTIAIGDGKKVRIKGITKDGTRGYFKVPRMDPGVYRLEFTSVRRRGDLVAPFDKTLSVVDQITIPRITKVPKTFTSGETVVIQGENFAADGQTYLNGAFGKLTATESTQTSATFYLPTLVEMLGSKYSGIQSPKNNLPFVLSTDAGQVMFVGEVQLR